MYKQIIIVRNDLGMSIGKLSAQVSHASMAFLTNFIRDNTDIDGHVDGWIDKNILDNWINDIFTKIVLKAKNKNQLLKAKNMAEEIDENGIGRTLTCIGFKPMDSDIIDKISKKYQLYK